MSDHLSQAKVSKLLEKLKNDLPLARKLGLVEVDEDHSDSEELDNVVVNTVKRKSTTISPLRTKKFKKTPAGTVDSLNSEPSASIPLPAGSLNPIAHCVETSNACASNKNDDKIENSDESSEEGDPLDNMEDIINNEDLDDSVNNQESEEDSDNSDDLKILGGPEEAAWVPSKKSLEFYLKVADLELNKDVIKDIESNYKADEEVEKHFHPPKFPTPFWHAVQNSPADSYKLKAINKVQENLFLAIKPLLKSLDSVPKSVKNEITQSVQLICSANLNLNRFRRATIAPHLKPDMKRNLMSLPVCHDSFFGEDFNKTADSLLKEQASIDKVLNTKPKGQKSSYKSGYSSYKSGYPRNNNYPSTSGVSMTNQRFFRGNRGRSGSFSRGGSRGRRGFNQRRGSNKPTYDLNQPGPSGNQNPQ